MEKILLITGGAVGIGAAIALQAAEGGFAICVNYNSSWQAAETLCERISALGARIIAVRADVSVERDVLRLFNEVDAQLGLVTHLVNNAGVIAPIKKFDATTIEDLQRVFAVNVFGSFLCAREAVKRMCTLSGGKGGAIVNMSSAASRIGSPNEFIEYAASKGAIDTFTLGLSKEVAGRGIRVNAVRPGLIDTDIHAHAGDASRAERLKSAIPMQRVGLACEVAEAVMWLLSDSAAYVTGTTLDVAGGR